mgnify:CR=1 FL=1
MSVIKKFRITKIKNSKPLISLKKISLSFKKNHLILDNISLDISKGQVIGLLGPNGAGKTTLMNLITGVIKPNYGNIIIDGNKRIGLACALIFLDLNGILISTGTDQLYVLTMEVAQGRKTKEEIALCFKELDQTQSS